MVHHHGKVTHHTKLQFCVQWKPNEGIVSPDTWLAWNQARWLDVRNNSLCTDNQTIPRLHYLTPLMPAAQLSLPHSANSTTSGDSQPLRLMKGSDAEHWREASAEEFDRFLSTTATMHFIQLSDKPADRLASYIIRSARLKRHRQAASRNIWRRSHGLHRCCYHIHGNRHGIALRYPIRVSSQQTLRISFLCLILSAQSTCGSRFSKYLPAYNIPTLGEL